jgi:serine phosphatase RsbU (regulator of sigma subunit)
MTSKPVNLASTKKSEGLTTRDLVESLRTLNQIAETLNQAVDVRAVLNTTLAQLVELMGLETGWIFLKDETAQDRWAGQGYVLAAHHNLPPALALDKAEAWRDGCDCQGFCRTGKLNAAYNEVRCSRLAGAGGDRRGLAVHASSPLRAGNRILGIVNVAGPDWEAFSPQALALLTNAGSQMGIALERARLFDLLQERHIHEQAALLEFSNQLLSRLDLDDLIYYLVEAVRDLLQVDACALLLPAQEPGYLAFQAVSGWRHDPAAAGQRVPADERSGSGRAMRYQQPVLIEDVQQKDPTPWTTGWLEAEGFRGHAVMPMIVEGRSIGTLVIDIRQPRLLDENELRFLRLMANQAAMAIEKARLHQEEVERRWLEKELALGRDIQLSLLPASCPEVAGWEFAAAYEAAHLVGGDFYDFFELPGEPGRLGLVIADVAGKGVSAALFMALSRTIIRTTALSSRNPAATLERANELILKDSQANRFVSAFYGALDTNRGRLIFANGGHNQPLWRQAASGRCQKLVARGAVLGVFDRVELAEAEVEIAPGDLLLFYTDGVTEAMNGEEEMFGEERLEAVLAARPEAGALEMVGEVVRAVAAFTGPTPRSDDFTLFVVKRVSES